MNNRIETDFLATSTN